MMQDLCSQIEHLQRIAFVAHEQKAKSEELRIQSKTIPEMEAMERLLRYETALERGFDRALSQLAPSKNTSWPSRSATCTSRALQLVLKSPPCPGWTHLVIFHHKYNYNTNYQ